ncbi:pyruvate, phosphate dikinase [Halosquirtibacter xylanolyticus]|uniref:PEP/pyruvate-binding domain-containing protein n=1 Tax=Halosquirtibacter xylanolyticus TaxID=3374599 RepID=UPI0037483C9D|nr:pyruvate, phosphate dikinase [Prolixibacteraceae bacterium]
MTDFQKIPLTSIYKRQKSDRDIFQELMPTKVKEILVVATVYDAYSIVREGQFSDKIFGEYLQLNLYASPRFSSVNSQEDALQIIHKKHFDMVIIMAGVDKNLSIEIAENIHFSKSRLPILMLANNNHGLEDLQREVSKVPAINRLFVWNGNSNVFVAMIKYVEDMKNAARDTKLGNVRIILLVEDSVRYYSRYLPVLYTAIMTQTQNLVSEESSDELHMILKMRARPKVLLVSNYEDAIKIIDEYSENLLCVISDVRFPRHGIDDEDSGVNLLIEARKKLKYSIPTLLQSHDPSNRERAKKIGANFIDKNSEKLSLEIMKFINDKLGFGDFIFRDPDGNKIGIATDLDEFEELLHEVPSDSLIRHARINAFSSWLMARGEINIAEQLLPYNIEDFSSPEELREFCIRVFLDAKQKKHRGQIINFTPKLCTGNRYIVRMGRGSLGGKGRGLAFISNLIENIDFKHLIKGINIRQPATAVIGAVEFDRFIEMNNLYDDIYQERPAEEIRKLFLEAEIGVVLKDRLYNYLKEMKKPLAIRSSGLFEDSLLQPFSGVYSTYLIPNNHTDINTRLEQLCKAIKLVYASIFTETAESYFHAVNYKIEEEKMAVVIQEVVGHDYNAKFYPNISGVAQSYNYYPFSYMKPEDGFAVIAVGLGMHVVGGNKAFRFCPAYPRLINGSLQDQMRDSQRFFNAIDLSKSEINLEEQDEDAAILKLRIADADKDNNLNDCASTYNHINDIVEPGTFIKGPRIINFANILQYDSIPLAQTIQLLLNLFEQAMGSPVEMEFAVDLEKGEDNKPTFYILQIKPLIQQEKSYHIDLDQIDEEKLIMKAKKGMGNGKLDNIKDIVYIDPDLFDKLSTKEMAEEIRKINTEMVDQNKEYVLIGPGRWGTRDPHTGIPVLWANISNAKVIVEIGLPDFPLDASLGSHFFHNVTSMNVGYFSIPFQSEDTYIDLNKIAAIGEVTSYGKFTKHAHIENGVTVLMDGSKQTSIIQIN